jgi:hypothetical protein
MAWDITTNSLPSINWEEDDLQMQVHIAIQKGEITARCEIRDFEEPKFTAVLVRVSDIVRATVNLIAFRVGAALSVAIEGALMPNNRGKLIILRDRVLESRCKSFALYDDSFNAVSQLVLSDTRLYHAFRDLIDAISIPHILVPRCASAIETLRVCISPPGADRKAGWESLQSNLNLTEEYLKSITDHSRGPRHGDHQYIPGTTTELVANNAWIVMDRYLEYLKRGKQPLPLSEFPLLG